MSEQHEGNFKGLFFSNSPLANRDSNALWNMLASEQGVLETSNEGTENEFKTNACALICELKCWLNNLLKGQSIYIRFCKHPSHVITPSFWTVSFEGNKEVL